MTAATAGAQETVHAAVAPVFAFPRIALGSDIEPSSGPVFALATGSKGIAPAPTSTSRLFVKSSCVRYGAPGSGFSVETSDQKASLLSLIIIGH